MIRHNILTNAAARDQFIEGCHRLKARPWPGQQGLGMYDFFVFWHHRAMMVRTPASHPSRNAAHSGPVFPPWHRYMLLMFEFYLRDELDDENFRLPYWSWTADAQLQNAGQSQIWSASVLGGSGAPVQSGPFAPQSAGGRRWEVRLEGNPGGTNPRRVSRGLQRDIGRKVQTLPSLSQVRSVSQANVTYDGTPFDDGAGGFRNALEGWVGTQAPALHYRVHVYVGLDMERSTSPNDPAFFLHHCNIDRIWAAWRQRHGNPPYVPAQNASADLTFHRLDDRMHTFFDQTVTPAMMLDPSPYYRYDTLADLL
jgi:tyrosinase